MPIEWLLSENRESGYPVDAYGNRLPTIGDRVWFLGELQELQGLLKITDIKLDRAQVIVKPVENEEEDFNGWAVWWKDITYKEPVPLEDYD